MSPAPTSCGARNLAVLDLFAGAGGLTEGFHQAGAYQTVRAVEMDQAAAATYEANFGAGIVFNGAIADWLAEGGVPEVDIIVGGPPCQGFSTLGNQDAEDERNELWREYADTVVRANPKYFVLENVGAFMRSPQFRHLDAATRPGGRLENYAIQCDVLNAADYGAAQARKRTIVIGHHRDLDAPGLPAPTHVNRHVTVRQAIGRITRTVTEIDLPDSWIEFDGSVLPGRFTSRQLHLTRHYEARSLARIRTIPPKGNRFDIPPRLLSDCWKNHPSGSADVMGRLHWDRPAVTIRTEFYKPEKGRYLHPEEDRAITHYEAALLQGFPATFKWVGTKTAIGRQIGNAVPIPLSKAIARHLLSQF